VPTYQYACTECEHELEAVQKFTDDPLTQCPQCTGLLRKVFSAVGVVFKGSGFYRTDSRGKSSASEGGDSKAGKADSKAESGKSEPSKSEASKSESKSESSSAQSSGESAA
jgi:putative FmdB family regulatory protein